MPQRKATPRNQTPRELKRCALANMLLETETRNFGHIADPDKSSEFQDSLDHRFRLQEDAEEYEAKNGPLLGMTHEEKLKEIIEKQRAKHGKVFVKLFGPEATEEELKIGAEIEMRFLIIEAQLRVQETLKKESGEESLNSIKQRV